MRILAALGAVCLGFAGPNLALAAGEWPLDSGNYVEVSMIKVDDGHALDYATNSPASGARRRTIPRRKGGSASTRSGPTSTRARARPTSTSSPGCHACPTRPRAPSATKPTSSTWRPPRRRCRRLRASAPNGGTWPAWCSCASRSGRS